MNISFFLEDLLKTNISVLAITILISEPLHNLRITLPKLHLASLCKLLQA